MKNDNFSKKLKKIREEIDQISNLNNKLNGLIQITDKNQISFNSQRIMEILTNSYKNIGGFKTFDSVKDVGKKVNLLYGYFNYGVLDACAIYQNFLGGYKMVGCGTIDNSKENKQHIHEIIKNDIDNIKEWKWAEVSGGVERLFRKYGGNPIPFEIARVILRKDLNNIDGFHYNRSIGMNRDVFTKCIYGFPDKNVYDKVVNDIETISDFKNYQDFKNYANNTPIYENTKVKEFEDLIGEFNNKELFALEVLYRINNFVTSYNCYEITKNMYQYMVYSINLIGNKRYSEQKVNDTIEMSKRNIRYISVLKFGNGKVFDDYIRKPAFV